MRSGRADLGVPGDDPAVEVGQSKPPSVGQRIRSGQHGEPLFGADLPIQTVGHRAGGG
jgi:hypothetical protein